MDNSKLTTNPLYLRWIEKYVAELDGNVLQMCGFATEEMILDFPELKRVRGHVAVPSEGYARGYKEWPHWWCVAPDGLIVDPTAAQFPDILFYKEHDESKGEPTGKCPECGGLVYGGRNFCSNACESAFRSDLGI